MLRESQLRLTYLNDSKGGGNEYEKDFRQFGTNVVIQQEELKEYKNKANLNNFEEQQSMYMNLESLKDEITKINLMIDRNNSMIKILNDKYSMNCETNPMTEVFVHLVY
jgi:hypothetical protein